MIYLALGAAFVLAGVIGASAGFRWSIKQMRDAVDSMAASARTVGLSAQRLIGEAALLKYSALRRDADRPSYEFLEEEDRT